MLTSTEKIILQDYKKAFRKYYGNKEVIDLDKGIIRKKEWFLVRLDEVLPELEMTVPPNKQSNFIILYLETGRFASSWPDFFRLALAPLPP